MVLKTSPVSTGDFLKIHSIFKKQYMELNKLKEHLPYQWRVQECKEYGANCVAYIDSRDVQNRLDEAVGPQNWQSDYKAVNEVVYGGIGILVNGEWVWKWDCGTESNVEKEKGEASDAFKRAAVKWGIGRFLYDLKVVKLKTVKYEKNGKYYPANSAGEILWDGEALTNYINSMRGLTKQAAQPARTTIKEAEKQNEEIKNAIKDLLDCKSIEDLQKLVGDLPGYVIANESFKKAGAQRKAELLEAAKKQLNEAAA